MKPKYNTWIKFRKMMLFVLVFIFLVTLSLCMRNMVIKFLLLGIAVPIGYISVILLVSYYYFSEKGGNYQEVVHDIIVSKVAIETGATILDIGAGSGSLAIKTAKKNKQSSIKAIDYWGSNWQYSKQQCTNNAKIEHVDQQIEFIKASASELPFASATFDVVISCLTFHEVKDTNDKSVAIIEAFRVLKKGGKFVFFDLFNDEKQFGEFHDFQNKLKNNDVEILEVKKFEELIANCPKILLNRKVLGHGILIVGKKL